MYKATIILPCYNKEDYVERAIKSIIKQSRFKDFEVIFVDDCSTDNTVKIIEKYTKKYENISLIKFEKGSGSPSKPRNVGIEKSTTDYLIFMDPDDQIINDGYSLLLSKMEEYKSDILIATRIGVNDYGQQVFMDFRSNKFSFINKNDYSIKLDLLNRPPFILKTIYSKKLIVDNKIKFNEKISTSEDEAFDMTCVAYAKKISKIDDIIYQYTSESVGSITTSIGLKVYEDLYEIFKELTKAYKLTFDDTVIAERLVGLLDTFYINKISMIDSYENVMKACELIYDSLDKYGYKIFDKLVTRRYVELIDSIKRRDLSEYVIDYFIKRVDTNNKKLVSLNKKVEKQNKTLDRKTVRLGILLSKIVSDFKNNLLKGNFIKKRINEKAKYTKKFKKFYHSTKDVCNDYWVFQDRRMSAKDNGEALYRYVMKNKIHDKIAYILDKKSIDYKRLKDEGFNIIEYDSLEHWETVKNAKYFFTSHCDDVNVCPWYYFKEKRQGQFANKRLIKYLYKLVFLQHGVIRSDLSNWLGIKDIYKFVCSSPIEKYSLENIPRYRLTDKELIMSGLPRWDNLKDNSKNIITVFPTWRKEIVAMMGDNFEKKFKKTPFYNNWVEFFNSDIIKELSKKYEINFVGHNDNNEVMKFFKKQIPDFVTIKKYSEISSFFEIVNTSKMLVTDYSSFSFDFLFLKKPVVYFDFEKNALINNYVGMEYNKFGYYCTNMDEVNESFKLLKKNNFEVDNDRMKNLDGLFYHRDNNNSKRVIDNILKEEKKK